MKVISNTVGRNQYLITSKKASLCLPIFLFVSLSCTAKMFFFFTVQLKVIHMALLGRNKYLYLFITEKKPQRM